jgi:hypothetical protein
MHERLRLELLRRIQRGSLSVSLLARQTGFGQPHLSNFLNSRRQLSMNAMDRILAAQHLNADDLLPVLRQAPDVSLALGDNSVPLVSHASALFEPQIRASSVHSMLHVQAGVLGSFSARTTNARRAWQRFVAVRIPASDAHAMDPIVLPEAIVLIDRHYNVITPNRPNRPNLFAVRDGTHLNLRNVDFLANRLVLRPHNRAFAVELIEIEPGESPADLLTGRIALIINEP